MHVRERAHSATMPHSAREGERGREERGREGGGERFSVGGQGRATSWVCADYGIYYHTMMS